MSELWSIPRTARHLDVTKKRVYQLIRQGKLDACKLGPRMMRVTRISLENFVTEQVKKEKQELGLDIEPAALRTDLRRKG